MIQAPDSPVLILLPLHIDQKISPHLQASDHIQAGLLKKGLCSVQDESAGQLVIFSHRRDAYKAVISKVSFPFFCILL